MILIKFVIKLVFILLKTINLLQLFRLVHFTTVSDSQQAFHLNIGITHVFSCINICRVPRKAFEHKTDKPSAQISPEGPSKC